MPDLSDLETRYATEAVASTWISSTGAFLDRFESEFAEASGTNFALGTTSGTTALHLALAALGLGQGDEVIVPSMTYIATANAVRYCGAEPVFVDIDPATWCLDPTAIEAAITPKTKGIIPVHLLGHPADMDPREFLLGIEWDETVADWNKAKELPIRVTVRYFACSDDDGWCKPFTQKYDIFLQVDRDGGGATRRWRNRN